MNLLVATDAGAQLSGLAFLVAIVAVATLGVLNAFRTCERPVEGSTETDGGREKSPPPVDPPAKAGPLARDAGEGSSLVGQVPLRVAPLPATWAEYVERSAAARAAQDSPGPFDWQAMGL